MGKYYNNRPTSKLEQIRDSALKIHDRIDPGHDIISHDEGEPGYYNDRPKTKLETIRDAAECIAQITENPTEEYQYEDLRNVDVASFVSEVTAPIKKLTVGIEPVQDLHGYDNPWPAGGGKNLLKNELVSGTQSGVTITVDEFGVITLNGTATANFTLSINSSIGLGAGEYIINGVTNGRGTTYKLEARYNGTWGHNVYNGDTTASVSGTFDSLVLAVYSGAVLSNVVIKPMIRLSSASDATYAPYSNICPITGRTGTKVTSTGKNLLDETTVFTSLGFTHENDGSWSRGNITGISNALVWKNPGFASQISISFTAKYASDTSTGIRFKFLYSNGTTLNLYLTPSLTYQHYSFTSTSGKIVSSVNIDYGSNNIKTWFKDVQIEADLSATAYEPYQGETYDITFPSEAGTVYGGTLNVTTGLLTVDRAMVTFDGTESSTDFSISTASAYRNRIAWNPYERIGKLNGTFLANILETRANSSGGVGNKEWQIWGGTAAARMWISVPKSIASVSDFIVFCASTNISVAYELATPITYQLTPRQITTLLGENNVWADTGEIVHIKYPYAEI